MYSDPSLIRDVIIQVRLDDWEWDMLSAEAAACDMTTEELMHELFVEGAKLELDIRLLS